MKKLTRQYRSKPNAKKDKFKNPMFRLSANPSNNNPIGRGNSSI
jgi:hypothetical protein